MFSVYKHMKQSMSKDIHTNYVYYQLTDWLSALAMLLRGHATAA